MIASVASGLTGNDRFRTVSGFFRLVKSLNVPEFLGMNLYDKLSGI